MTAGVPGIGLSGIFYILCGLLMPVIEFFSVLCKKSKGGRWKLVLTQFALSAGILLVSWGFGLLIGMAIHACPLFATSFAKMNAVNVFRVQPLIISLFTLLLVVGSARIAYWVVDMVKATRAVK